MPLHDWIRVPAGLFHDFHRSWSIRIKDALNGGRLPKGLSALVDPKAGPLESTCRAAWEASPEDFREAVETGVLPDPEAEDG